MCAAILHHNLTPLSTTLDIPLLGFNWSVLLWLHSCTPPSVTYAWRPAFFISIRYVHTGVKLNWLSRFSFRILRQLFQYVRCSSVLAIVSLSSRSLIVVAEIFECLVLCSGTSNEIPFSLYSLSLSCARQCFYDRLENFDSLKGMFRFVAILHCHQLH